MEIKQELGDIDIFLADSDLGARQSCKQVLYTIGFRGIELGQTIWHVTECLNKTTPDLLICSSELGDESFVAFISKIRRGEVGDNPFIPIITMVDNPTPDVVSSIVTSGTDAVIAKPLTMAAITGRVNDLIESRKRFIKADGYIGPIRSTDRQRGTIVPNTFLDKINGKKKSFAELERAVVLSNKRLSTVREEQIGEEISTYVTNLVPMLERGTKLDRTIRLELLGLLDATDAADDRLGGTEFEFAIELCNSIAEVAGLIISARGRIPDPKYIKLLKPLSQAIQACFSGTIKTKEQVLTIVEQLSVKIQ